MHVIVEFIEARPEHVALVRSALLMLSRQAIGLPGCQHIDVSADPLEPTGFLLYGVYDDEAAVRAHRETPEHQAMELTLAPWLAHRRMLSYELISEHGQA